MRDSKLLTNLAPYDPKYIDAKVLLSANESPIDVPAEVKLACLEKIQKLSFNRYPQPTADQLRELIASNIYNLVLPTLDDDVRDSLNLPPVCSKQIVIGNGGDELLFNFMLAFGGENNKLLVTPPCFSVYSIDASMTNTDVVEVLMDSNFEINEEVLLERASQDDINMIILTSPNNPTGGLVSYDLLERLLKTTNAVVMLDEAYGEFSEKTAIPLINKYSNLVVLRTFSKAYSLAGIRLGYIVASEDIAQKFMAVRQPYSVDAIAQAVGMEVTKRTHLYKNSLRQTIARRQSLLHSLRCINGVEAFESAANFVMVRVRGASEVWKFMVEQGVLVRNFDGAPGLSGCLRITVGTDEENQAMLDALAAGVVRGFSCG